MARIPPPTIAIVVLLSEAAAAAPAPAQFDMMCHGHSVMQATGAPTTDRPDNSHMSVDLGRKVWCWRKDGACAQVLNLVGADDTGVTLTDHEDAGGLSHIRLALPSGALTSHVMMHTSRVATIEARLDSTCTMAPYTPVP